MPILEREGEKFFYEIGGVISNRAPLLLTHSYSATLEMWQPTKKGVTS